MAEPSPASARSDMAAMPKDNESQRSDRRRAFVFVAACAAIFLILAACAIYVVVTLAI
jgi:hypothetical protein